MALSPKWKKEYMEDALKKALRSPDTTKVGAIIVHPDNYEVSNGYNDFPRGVKYDSMRAKKPTKYDFTVHAEQNALMTALFMGVSVRGCWIFVTKFPCCECAKLIIQSGIKKVIYLSELEGEKWEQSSLVSLIMLKEAGIEVEKYDETV